MEVLANDELLVYEPPGTSRILRRLSVGRVATDGIEYRQVL